MQVSIYLILDLKKAQKTREIDILTNKVDRLQQLIIEKDHTITDLELKTKKLQAQFDVASKQKMGAMGGKIFLHVDIFDCITRDSSVCQCQRVSSFSPSPNKNPKLPPS